MCGIVGAVASRDITPLLIEGLKRLEYRGYDSAGIATLVDGHIDRRRAEGKLSNLAAVLEASPLPGTTGIGHTRWATHGAPTERNAHPHGTPRVSVVHNGIIENHAELRAETQIGVDEQAVPFPAQPQRLTTIDVLMTYEPHRIRAARRRERIARGKQGIERRDQRAQDVGHPHRYDGQGCARGRPSSRTRYRTRRRRGPPGDRCLTGDGVRRWRGVTAAGRQQQQR